MIQKSNLYKLKLDCMTDKYVVAKCYADAEIAISNYMKDNNRNDVKIQSITYLGEVIYENN